MCVIPQISSISGFWPLTSEPDQVKRSNREIKWSNREIESKDQATYWCIQIEIKVSSIEILDLCVVACLNDDVRTMTSRQYGLSLDANCWLNSEL